MNLDITFFGGTVCSMSFIAYRISVSDNSFFLPYQFLNKGNENSILFKSTSKKDVYCYILMYKMLNLIT